MNRRRQYRVTADFDKFVNLELLGPKVHARNVRLLDLSSGGCGVELPAAANGMLRRNDTVNLRVISSRLPDSVDMKGTVAWLKEKSAKPQVGLNFVNWRQHRILLDSDLKGLFNEREAFRVTPDGRKPIDVELELVGDIAGTFTVRIRDVSLLGLGVSVSTKDFDQAPLERSRVVPPDRREGTRRGRAEVHTSAPGGTALGPPRAPPHRCRTTARCHPQGPPAVRDATAARPVQDGRARGLLTPSDA